MNFLRWLPKPSAWASAIALFFYAGAVSLAFALAMPLIAELLRHSPRLGWFAILGLWLAPVGGAAAIHHTGHRVLDLGDVSKVARGASSLWAGVVAWATIILVSMTASFVMLVLDPPPVDESVSGFIVQSLEAWHGVVRPVVDRPRGLRVHARARRTPRRVMRPALILLVAIGCGRHPAYLAPATDAGAEAAKLLPFLPATLGPYNARQPAMTALMLTGSISAERLYLSPDGRQAEVRISTGDVRGDLASLDSNDEHAFGSDSPTYWRTTSIAGHRTRIAEERPKLLTSKCLVRVGPNHVAEVRIIGATAAGDCQSVAALLDFAGIAATGGVPSPPAERR